MTMSRRVLATWLLSIVGSCGVGGGEPETANVAAALTSGPPGSYQIALVPARSTWSYFDQGEPPPGWQVGAFAPAPGPGPYGYGEGYITTYLAPGPITTYLRHDLAIDQPVHALFLRVMYDDGFVAYLNGVEVLRRAMPAGAVTHTTLALGHEALGRYEIFDLSAHVDVLQPGVNQLAIEVHQASTTSSDLVLDAELLAWIDGPIDVTAEGNIPRGSLWHVWDRVEHPGAWTAPAYDDSGWSAGPAPLGFGEAYLATVVHDDPITTYFRKPVVIEGNITALAAHVMYDDGFIAYLNGTEIARRAMPAGPVTPTTLASGHEANETYETIDLAHAIPLLVPGTNVLAVEVHQGGTQSSDLVFDLELDVTRGWTSQSLGTQALHTVYFADAQRGWVGGSGGRILRTDDSGASWVPQATGTTDSVSGLAFADADHGWALLGGGGDVLRTTDGGATWAPIDVPIRLASAIAPVDADTAWAVGLETGFDYNLYRTDDGGSTWQLARTLPGPGRVTFASATRGWLIYFPHLDDRMFVARTDDGGATWTDVWMGGTAGNRYGRGFATVGEDTLWLVGSENSGDVSGEWKMVTRDAGATWTVLPPTTNDVYLADVDFADAQHGWAVGVGGSIIHTDDGGYTWRVQLAANCDYDAPVTCGPPGIAAVHAADASHVRAVTIEGAVLRTSSGGN